ncbi:RNA-binding protein 25-like, partial [Trifolium medium]|nr:RNA-binding protein 25-like [Trifolium medium]
KVDKQGHRFGFVKFKEVTDATELLRRVSNIWLGSFKLRINISKFSKQSQPPAQEERQVAKKNHHHYAQKDKSFKNALVEVAVEGGRSVTYPE